MRAEILEMAEENFGRAALEVVQVAEAQIKKVPRGGDIDARDADKGRAERLSINLFATLNHSGQRFASAAEVNPPPRICVGSDARLASTAMPPKRRGYSFGNGDDSDD
jgi:hypothetical protein